MSFLAEIFAFMRKRKKSWLWPIVLVMLLVGGLMFFGSGSAVTPFVYTLF